MNKTPKLDLYFVFEKKVKGYHPEIDLTRSASGNYVNSAAHNLFIGFKLGLELGFMFKKV